MNCFLEEDDVASDLPFLDELSLIQGDEFWQDIFKLIHYNLSQNFICKVKKGSGPKSEKGCRPCFLGYESQERRINASFDFVLLLSTIEHPP